MRPPKKDTTGSPFNFAAPCMSTGNLLAFPLKRSAGSFGRSLSNRLVYRWEVYISLWRNPGMLQRENIDDRAGKWDSETCSR